MNLNKKCEVVILTTKDKTEIVEFGNQLRLGLQGLSTMVCYYVHLYILSDEKINENDYFLSDERNNKFDNFGNPIWKLHKCHRIENGWIYADGCDDIGYNPHWSKKVIAATDKTLKLPELSLNFLKNYIEENNKYNNIKFVNVDYENEYIHKCYYLKPKIDKNNCIIITNNGNDHLKEVCQKDWKLKEEVRNLLLKMSHDTRDYLEGINNGSEKRYEFNVDKWIEENL